jgi:TRAP transporter TAXI family solute receptor
MKKSSLITTTVSIVMGLVFIAFLVPAISAEAFKWPETLLIGTPRIGATSHSIPQALAPLIQKTTGVKRVRITPVESEAGRHQDLLNKAFDIDSKSVSDMELAIVGIGGNAEKERGYTRIIWHQEDKAWPWITLRDSPVNSIYDVKKQNGWRVAVNASAPAMVEGSQAFVAFLNLTPEEEKRCIRYVEFGSYAANCRSIIEDKADCTYLSSTASLAYEVAANPRGVKVIDLPLTDKKGWARFIERRPTVIPTTVTSGVKAFIGKTAFTSNYIYRVRADMSEDLAYNLSKWFHVHYKDYKSITEGADRQSIEIFREFLNHAAWPVHVGTVRYLKEIGMWTAKDDEWNQKAIEIEKKYNEAYAKAKAEAKKKNIQISISNKEWMGLWERHKAGLPRLRARL